MRTIKVLGFVCGVVVAAQSPSEDAIVGDRTPVTAPLEIDLGQSAATGVDCSKTFECELVSYDPVCGSDGVTYDNDCSFAAAFCASENDADIMFIRSIGGCPSAPDSDETPERWALIEPLSEEKGVDVRTESSAETNTEVDLMTVFCSLTCKLTPDQVCGTDGVTYINDCHLLSSKCEHPELEKASHGECMTSITLTVLEVGDAAITDAPLTAAPEKKCNPMCERVYDPICGSDGVTYANSCLLEYAECRNPNVKAFGAGKCPPHMQAARAANNPTATALGGESCIPGPCSYLYAPVCGSDGQTHNNLCLFANARCQHPQRALTVVHDGECDADTQLTCETMTCPTFTECREQVEPDEAVIAYCADVCSADRCSEREDCELVDSDCFTAPCSPIAMCVPKVQDG
ncbi:Basement membrane-specific heparan sulfate proteoglycan core protein [Phytophthora pseudosyringae]|uniref:Basement membrane-specific heparan sulfate proteoglycan core protein n=1 Tax=Phytophthora pseudosyringae TaxID=221518 RepID=A0A8T1VEK2_9STRA|nr:Basement membrane-specific heparan sulfate proteoglycan core protein [Phytophthora pseudosyringae]